MVTLSRGLLERPRAWLVVLPIAVLVGSLVLAFRASVSLAVVDQADCGIHPLDVELIIDRSGSMQSEQSGGHTRIYWARQAANQLIDDLNGNGGVGGSGIHHVGLTVFGGVTSSTLVALGGSDAAALHSAVNGISASGNTPLKLGLATGAADMSGHMRVLADGLPVIHVMVMLSDGRPNPDPAQRPNAGEIASYLGSADVAYSIAIGDGGSGATQIDLGLMMALASPASAYHHVVEASDLPGLFADIFSELACPQIGIDKSANVSSLPPGGGEVTYSYAVTNSVAGAPLSNVEVTDDKCSPVDYESGDTNGDDLLQSTETWWFSCTTTLIDSTTNIGTASGDFNGSSFTAKDDATVVVEEATPTPTPVEETPTPVEETPTPTPTPVEETPTPTPEESIQGGTGTPAPSLPDSALGGSAGHGSWATLAFGLVLLLGLTALARVNLVAARRRP
jgi:Mg-chelatase subunit ChlD